MPTCTCSGCGRAYSQSLARMVDSLRKGRTRCQMCGEDLVYPDEAVAALGGGAGAPDMAALTKYTCNACNATYPTSPADLQKRRALGCKMCGAPLRADTLAALDGLAPERAIEVEKTQQSCLLCLRETWVESTSPHDVHHCRFCGIELQPPPLDEEPARREDVEQVFGDLVRGGDMLSLAKDALLARAQHEDVGPAEVRRLAHMLGVVARWRPEDGAAYLPLPLVEAVEAVPPLLYPGKHVQVERYDEHTDLVFVLGATAGRDGSATRAAAVNAVGLATLAFAGAGLFITRPGLPETDTDDQHRMRIALQPEGEHGVNLWFFTQRNNEQPRAVGTKEQTAFGALIAGQRDLLDAYYGTLAVFGAWIGSRAALATVPAIAARLESLGLGARAAERLCMERRR